MGRRALLRDFTGCDLLLMPPTPAAAAGIAFIGQFPKTCLMFVFALGSVFAVGALKTVACADASLLSFKFALFGLVASMQAAPLTKANLGSIKGQLLW